MQIVTGYLNFLSEAIQAGRTFTRRMYNKTSQLKYGKNGKMLKPYHHVSIDGEFRFDCEVWKTFLLHFRDNAVCRPMIDFNRSQIGANQLNFTSDASASETLRFGATFRNQWIFGQWEVGHIKNFKPNIEYLELFAVVAALLKWGDQLKNVRFTLFCDNQAVIEMINSQVSRCRNCMYLLRLMIMNNLVNNRKVYAKYIRSEDNDLSDVLSSLQFKRFWNIAPESMSKTPSMISPLVWLASKIWQSWNN